MRIGVFDSGVGGLTVLKELISKKPNNDYYYIGDTLNMPYGAKTKDELRKCVDKILKYFIEKKVDLVIIACGTVSSVLYEDLKKDYNLKIIDIISPTINYIKEKNIDNIGVIATVNTIKSNVFQNKLNDRIVYANSCPELASLIEEDSPKIGQYVSEILENFKNKKIDLMVLGCTHYPVVSDLIEEKGYKTLNMGVPLIQYIDEANDSNIEIKYTKLTEQVKSNTNRILDKLIDVEEIEL